MPPRSKPEQHKGSYPGFTYMKDPERDLNRAVRDANKFEDRIKTESSSIFGNENERVADLRTRADAAHKKVGQIKNYMATPKIK